MEEMPFKMMAVTNMLNKLLRTADNGCYFSLEFGWAARYGIWNVSGV
jgi:hypothetical protein